MRKLLSLISMISLCSCGQSVGEKTKADSVEAWRIRDIDQRRTTPNQANKIIDSILNADKKQSK